MQKLFWSSYIKTILILLVVMVFDVMNFHTAQSTNIFEYGGFFDFSWIMLMSNTI